MTLEQFVTMDGYAQGLMAAAVKMQAEAKEMFARSQLATADDAQDIPSASERIDAIMESARQKDSTTNFDAIEQHLGKH